MKLKKIFLVLFFVLLHKDLYAHSSVHSLIEINYGKDVLQTTIHLPLIELELALTNTVNGSKGFDREKIKSYILQHIDIETIDGKLWKKTFVGDIKFQKLESKNPELLASLQFIPPNSKSLNQFNLHSDLIEHSVHNHEVYVLTKSDWRNGVLSNNGDILGVIKFMKNDLLIHREQGSFLKGFIATFKSGVHHITKGVDHLLFILMLLLPAPLIANFSSKKWNGYIGVKNSAIKLVKIVTAFTIGHSITLYIGSLKLINISEQVTESLIAISVLISAIHAIRPIFPKIECYIALFFGFIHGLAFSNIVDNFGLSADIKLVSILGFNLGVEAMQLFFLLILMPWIYLAASRAYYSIIRVPIALFGTIASTSWLLQRAFNLHIEDLDSIIESIQQQYIIVYSVVIFASLVLYFLDQAAEKVKVVK